MNTLLDAIRNGNYDAAFQMLYGSADRSRAEKVAAGFLSRFPENRGTAALYSAPGRTELGGNHTDHQHGRVLCASVDLDILACAAPNGLGLIRVCSEGYPALEISLEELQPRQAEQGSSQALVRGICAQIAAGGFRLGGVDVYAHSTVLSGSGLSSSAAYEILMGTILNDLFCENRLTPTDLAIIGQQAEKHFFGKPCGLMDQMGASIGGAVALDFRDPNLPEIQPIAYDFSRSGHVLCVVDTRSEHADLTGEYAAIPREMGAVAACFGKEVLRQVPEAEFRARLPELRSRCGDRAVLRALHFYGENKRVIQEAEALEQGDFPRFLKLVTASGLSSSLLLQNISVSADPAHQAVALALALGRELLAGAGAIRVHGGGFAGTILAFVPAHRLEGFRNGMEQVFGPGACHVLRIRPVGGCVLHGETEESK